jgi:response regulator RpfG family c-di-GMP phosphodiesterase
MGEMALQTVPQVVPTVIYLDDDAANRQAFMSSFRKEMRILLAADTQQLWQLLAKEEVHVFIADQRLPGMQGSEVLRQVREKHPLVQRMIMTGYSDIQAVIDAINHGGVSQYLHKPWDHEQVIFCVRKAFLEYMKERERNDQTQRLMDANQQLEFALRQRLLS